MESTDFQSATSNEKATLPISRHEPKRLFVYLTCVYILTWYLQLGNRVGILGAIRFEFLLGFVLSLSALFTYFSEPQKHTPLLKPTLFFWGILTLYTLFSHDFSFSWNLYFDRVVKFSMLGMFLSVFVRTPWALKMVVGAFLLAMLKLGQEGFMGWLTGGQVWENQGIMRLHGSVSMYASPNSFSGMAVGCLPFIYYLYPSVAKLWKCCLLLLLIFCIVIIIYTGSRTGYIATVGVGLVFILKTQGRTRLLSLTMAVLVAGGTIFLVPSDYKQRFESIFASAEKRDGSTAARLDILKDSVSIYLAYPFGVGVGAFPLVRAEMFGRSQDTHNLYLELLTNLGPLGLVSFFVLVYRILWTNIDLQKRLEATHFPEKSFVMAISKSIVVFLYARLFLGLFGMDTYEIYWWFAVGMTVALWNITKVYAQDNSLINYK